jgi:protein TIF31
LPPQLLKDQNFTNNKLQLLRSFCKKVGIQLVSREYDLSQPTPFSGSDINSLFAVVKHTIQPSKDATELLDMGKALLSIGRLDKAFEVLQEALSILHQTCGPMHALTASCYSNLAMTLYSAGDINQALAYQQKALIINERVHGLDHPDTAHSYGNLALFCHGLQKTENALSYINRALYLLKLCCGEHHPDIAATYINMAMMYQDTGNVPLSLRYLHEAKEKNQALLGADHIQTATTYHAMAVTMSVIGLYSLSVKHETKTFEILTSKLGDKDQRTRESAVWLAYFKQHASDAAQGKQQPQQPPQSAKIDSQPVLFANGGVKGPLQAADVESEGQPAPEGQQQPKKGRKGKK